MNETTIPASTPPAPAASAANWFCAGWERAWVAAPFGPKLRKRWERWWRAGERVEAELQNHDQSEGAHD